MNARQIGDQLANGMQYSVICSEDEPLFAARTSIAPPWRKLTRARTAGRIAEDLRALAARADGCRFARALHSDIPTLLLSGEADPVTPPADAERAAAA